MINIELYIENEGIKYKPIVEDRITLEWALEGSPGKLSFKVYNDNTANDQKINFQEGNPVRLTVDGVNLFFGFVFSKKRTKEQIISVTAYDQLRYFKNKETIHYKDLTAAELIKQIAKRCLLQCGDIAETSVPLQRREENTTYFDMIKNALAETRVLTGKTYVLYDDFRKLMLKSVEDMVLDCLICGDTAENFNYETSIDGETYNQIKLVCPNGASGNQDVFLVKDSGNIEKWGLLQYYEQVSNPADAANKAEGLLWLYNSKRRRLSVSGVLGDMRVRAGSVIPVSLTLGDINANSYLLVENVRHTFETGRHFMDLELRGGNFV